MTVPLRAPAISAARFAGVRTNRRFLTTRVPPTALNRSNISPYGNLINFGHAVPGLGFDYVHLAAISGHFRNGVSSDFDHAGHRRRASFFTPIFFYGYPYYSDFVDFPAYGEIPQQPQQIVIQQPPPIIVHQQAPVVQEPSNHQNGAAAIPATRVAAPESDLGGFILIRRDGRVLFASAYSVINSELRYVTPQGIRRTLPLNELDANATQQMNEARGTTLQLPD